ncbi:MAG: pirin family protein [Synechococcus sp.]
MTITIRSATDRGAANLGWLDSRHSFSFGQYYDPAHMGFGNLRVINEDKVAPGAGFGTHGHRDMEIISYVLSGSLKHEDSIGNGSVIRPGDVQRMTAGTGIRHSEFNGSDSDLVHFLQIWVLPEQEGLDPSYEQKHFDVANNPGQLWLVGSRDGREGSISIHQDVDLYAATLREGNAIQHELQSGRIGWIQVTRGMVTLNNRELTAGDGAALEGEGHLNLQGLSDDAEVLLFDMAN